KATGWVLVKSIPTYTASERPVHTYSRKINHKYRDSILFAISEYQKEYLRTRDIKDLKPMRLVDISKITKINISLICLHVKGMEIDGVPVKALFSNAIGMVSREVVKAFIKDIIGEEGDTPLSDSQLARKLEEDYGIKLARRTVTKY